MPTAILVGGSLSGMRVEVREHQAVYRGMAPTRESTPITLDTRVRDVFYEEQSFILHTITMMDLGQARHFIVGINTSLCSDYALSATTVMDYLFKEFNDIGGQLYGWGN